MASYFLTKAQRKTLIDSYIECADEMGEDSLDEMRSILESLGNAKLVARCVDFMPDCMHDL